MSKAIWTPDKEPQRPPGVIGCGINGESVVVMIQYPNLAAINVALQPEEARGFIKQLAVEIVKAEEIRLKNQMEQTALAVGK